MERVTSIAAILKWVDWFFNAAVLNFSNIVWLLDKYSPWKIYLISDFTVMQK